MNITVIETPGSGGGEYAVIYGMAAWPERTLRHRGWLRARIVYERPATADEVEEQRASPRHLAWRYPNWLSCASDEQRYGVPITASADEARRQRRAAA